jgi:cell shape-determining protein MreC
MDHPLDQQLKRINEKLQHFLKQYQLLQKENEKLKQEIGEKTIHQKVLAVQSDKLQQQIEILKVSKGEMNNVERKAFEKRLNQYIKEIDRCISLLNE